MKNSLSKLALAACALGFAAIAARAVRLAGAGLFLCGSKIQKRKYRRKKAAGDDVGNTPTP